MRSSISSAKPQHSCRGGFSIIYIPLILLLLVAFVAMAVDTGRIRLAKAQLQGAADAAARAGAASLPIVPVPSCAVRAELVAEANAVAEANVQLDPNTDLQFGTWNSLTHLFTPINDDSGTPTYDERNASNACRAFTLTSAARGNSIPLWITPHVTTFDRKAKSSKLSTTSNLNTQATAKIGGGPDRFGFVGIDSVTFSGHPAIDSRILPSTTRRPNGGIASNGVIDLGGQGDVYGDVRPGFGQKLTVKQGNEITGWTAPLDYVLNYPPAVYPGGGEPVVFTRNQPLTLVGSNDPANPKVFYLDGDLDKPTPLNIEGYVTLYVTGSIFASGNGNEINSNTKDPARLTINVVGNGSVDMGGNANSYVHLYAPQSDVTIHGDGNAGDFFGWAIGKTLRVTGNAELHYDETRDNHAKFTVQLVK